MPSMLLYSSSDTYAPISAMLLTWPGEQVGQPSAGGTARHRAHAAGRQSATGPPGLGLPPLHAGAAATRAWTMTTSSTSG